MQQAWHTGAKRIFKDVLTVYATVYGCCFTSGRTRTFTGTQAPAVDFHCLCACAHRHDAQHALALHAGHGHRAAAFARFSAADHCATRGVHQPAPCAEVFVRLAHFGVRDGRVLAQHRVDALVQVVYPAGQRVAVLEHVRTVAGRAQVGREVVTALATRQHVLERVKKALVLPALRGGRVRRVVERDRVQRHPQRRSPHAREEAVVAVEVVGREGKRRRLPFRW